MLPAELELSQSATIRGFLKHPLGFVGSEFAYGFVKAPLPDPESLPDGYSLEFGEVANIPFTLEPGIFVSVVTAPTSGNLNLTQSFVEYTPQTGFSGEDFFALEFWHEMTGLYFVKGFTMVVEAEPNHMPVFTNLASQSTDEDVALVIPLSFSDLNGDALVLSADFAPSTLGSVFVSGTNLIFVPVANQSGIGDLTVSVCETSTPDQYCVTQSISLTVTPVDDAPTLILSDTSVVFDRNTTTSIAFSVLEVDGDSVNLGAVAYTGTVTNMFPSSDLGFAIENGMLTIIPAPNFYGTLYAGLQVCDATTESLCHFSEIAVTVNFVNQPPLTGYGDGDVSFSLNEDSFYSDTWMYSDPEGTEVTVTIYTAPLQGSLGIDATGFEYTPVADFYGNDSFVLQFEDSEGGVSYQTFVATINPVNDDPVIISTGAISINEGSTNVMTVVATDVDNNVPLIFSLEGGADQGSFIIHPSTGILSFVSAPDFEEPEDSNSDNVYEVLVKVTDSLGAYSVQPVFVTVLDVNSPPVIAGASRAWENLGSAGLSGAAAENQSLAVDSQNNIYLAYRDYAFGSRASVMLWNGSAWSPVGTLGLSDAQVGGTALAVDSSDALYLAYNLVSGNAIHVKRFNGSNWETYGSATVAVGTFPALGFDNQGQLFLAYSDSSLSGRATVRVLVEGEWVLAGTAGISSNTAQYLSIKSDPFGTMFLSYRHVHAGEGVGVHKFVNGNWVFAGDQQTMITYPLSQDLAFDSSGTPYIALVDNSNSNKATVVRLVGNEWQLVGPRAFTVGGTSHMNLVIDSMDRPYIIYSDAAANGKASAIVWDGTSWEFAGIQGFSAGNGYFHDAVIDSMDRILVGYRDDGNFSLATVMVLGNEVIEYSVQENSTQVATIIATDADLDPLVYAIVPGLDGALFTIDAQTGQLSFLNAPDYENPLDSDTDNTYNLVVSASEPSGSAATSMVSVSVTDVDDAPVLEAIADLVVDEDFSPFPVVINATDQDGDPLFPQMSSSNTSVAQVSVLTGGILGLTSVKDAYGSAVITVTVTSTIHSVSTTFLLTVNPVNDAPVPLGVGSGSVIFAGTSPFLSTGTGEYPAVAFNSVGVPYVAFHDATSGGVNVKKFFNGEWVLVGPANFSSGGGSWIEIAIHSDDTVFVAYEDLNFSNRITVRKFNGTNWGLVGMGVSGESADHVSLQINSNGFPWVAYRGQANGYQAKVMKFQGAGWGTEDVASSGRADLPRLVFDRNHRAYVAYQDFSNSERITVKVKLGAVHENNLWESLPLTGLPTGAVQFPSMTVDSKNRLWLAFKDFQNGGAATVARFEGTHWEIIGTAGIGNIMADWIDLKLDAADVPYLMFSDAGNANRARIFSYQGGAWFEPSGGPISEFLAERTRLAIGVENQVLAVYKDHDGKISAKHFRELGWSAYANENQSLAMSLQATDVEGMTVTYSVAGGADASQFQVIGDELRFINHPDFENPSDFNADGIYLLNVSVSDGALAVTVPVRIMVKNVNEAPVLLSIENLQLLEDFGFAVVRPTFFDLEGDTMTATVTSSNQAVATAKLIEGKYILINSVRDASGTATIVMSVSSTGMSTTVSFTVEVTPVLDEIRVLNDRDSNWPVLGSAGFSAGTAEYHSLIIAPDGMPVVSYRDSSFGNPLAVVRKWNGSTWASVGTDGFSSQSAPYHTLAYDSSDVLHLAYQDGGHGGRATLMRFADGAWNTVGSPGFTPGQATYVSLAFDSNDIPYVAYKDVPNGGKASVMRYVDGSWSQLGVAWISAVEASFLSFTIDPLDRPLIAYRYDADSGRSWVHRFEDGKWKHLNLGANVLASNAAWQSLKTDRFSVPYLAYIDQNSAELVLARYNEATWVELARSSVASGASEKYVTLLIDNRDQIYVSLRNPDLNDGDTVVLKYANSSLEFVGPSSGIAEDNTGFTAMAVDDDGKLYIAYQDGKFANKTTVRHQVLLPVFAGALENQLDAINIEAYFPEAGILEYAIVGGADQSLFDIDSSGQVQFLTAPDYEQPMDSNVLNMYEFSVQIGSGSLLTTVPVRVAVENVNEAPFITPFGHEAINEDSGSFTLTFSAMDPEGDSITYEVVSLHPEIISTPTINGTTLTITPMPNAHGTAAITVTAISAGGLTDSYTFFQTVSPINDDPSISNTLYTTWEFLGGTDMTETPVNDHLGFALSQDDVPYVAFSDNAWSGQMTVKSYGEGSWDTVGSGGFTTGLVSFIHLAMDNNDLPWVGFSDGSQANKASVMRFDGGSWVGVGAAGFTSAVDHLSFALSPTSTPYVAYSNNASGASRVSVMKYDGTTWDFVGEPYIRAETNLQMLHPAIAVGTDGTPYVIYRHSETDGHEEVASVMKYDGTTWVQVGPIGFSGAGGMRNVYDPYIMIRPDGAPVVSYRDRGSPGFNRTSVLYFDGTNWVPYGQLGFSEGEVNNVTVDIDSKGVPWASYKDQAYSDSAVLKKLDGSSWVHVGAPGITAGAANFLRIAVTSEDVPLIAYRQSGNSKPAVMKATSFVSFVVSENSSFTTTMTVFDVDGDTEFSFSLLGADSNFFTIHSTSGELSLIAPLNFEVPMDDNTDNVYEFTVEVADLNGGVGYAQVRVKIEDVNEAPYISPYFASNQSEIVTNWVNTELWSVGQRILSYDLIEEDGQGSVLNILYGGVTELGTVTTTQPGELEFTFSEPFVAGTTIIYLELCDDSVTPVCRVVELPLETVSYSLPTIDVVENNLTVAEMQNAHFEYSVLSYGPQFSITVKYIPQHGSVNYDEFSRSGIITYNSGAEYSGPDSFTMEVDDGINTTEIELFVTVVPPPPMMYEIYSENPKLRLNQSNTLIAEFEYLGTPTSTTWTLLEFPIGASLGDLEADLVDADIAHLTPTVPGRYKVRFDLSVPLHVPEPLELELFTRDEWLPQASLADNGFGGSLQMASSGNSIYARYMNTFNELEVKRYNGETWTATNMPYYSPAGMTVVGATVYLAYEYNSMVQIHRSNNNESYEQVGQSLPNITGVVLGHNLSEDVFLCTTGSTMAVQCYFFDGSHWIKAGDEFGEVTPAIFQPQLISHNNVMYYTAVHYSTTLNKDVPILYSYNGSQWDEETAIVTPSFTTILDYKAGFIGDQLWAMMASASSIFISRHDMVNGVMVPEDFAIDQLTSADMLVDNRGDIYLAILYGSAPVRLMISRYSVLENEWEIMTYPEDENLESLAAGVVRLARLSGVPHLAITNSSDGEVVDFYKLDRTVAPLVTRHSPISMNTDLSGGSIALDYSKELPTTAHIGAVSLKNELNGDGYYNASITNTDGEAELLLELTSNLVPGRRYTVEAGSTRVGGPALIEDYQDIEAPPFRFDFLTKAPHLDVGGDLNRNPSRNHSIAVAMQGGDPKLYVSAIEISTDLASGTKYDDGSWGPMSSDISASAASTSTAWIGIGRDQKPVITVRDITDRIQAHAWTGSSWSTQSADQGSGDLFGEASGHHVLASGRAPAGASPVHDYLYVMARMTSNSEIRVASLDTNGVWNLIATGGAIGNALGDDFAIAVGQDGMPYIVYKDDSNSEVQVKKWNGSTWSDVTAASPFAANTPNRMLQIEALGTGFVIVAGLEESTNNFRMQKYNTSSWEDYETPIQIVSAVTHYDMAFVDQTLFLAVSDSTTGTRIFYKDFRDPDWLEVISFPQNDLESPRFGSNGKNLYLIGNDPIADELQVYKLEPIGGFWDPGL